MASIKITRLLSVLLFPGEMFKNAVTGCKNINFKYPSLTTTLICSQQEKENKRQQSANLHQNAF